MSKKFQISLIVLVAVLLTLVLSIPGLARQPLEIDPNCGVVVPIVNKSGNIYQTMTIYMALNAYWEGGTLYNYCTGIIPWGEELLDFPGWRLLTFNEMCEYYSGYVECDKNFSYTDPTIWYWDTTSLYDPVDDVALPTDVWNVTMYRNGEFLFYKEYTPPE